MNRIKWTLAALAMLVALPAGAAEKGDAATVKANQNTGSSLSISDGTAWRTVTGTAAGAMNVKTTNGAQSQYYTASSGIASDLPALRLVKSIVCVNLTDYSEFEIRASWTAPDSDSVAVTIFLVGKETENAADGYDYLIDSSPANNGINGWQVGTAQLQTTATVWDGLDIPVPSTVAAVSVTAATAHGSQIGGVSTNMVQFPVANALGARPRFRYATVWVLNKLNEVIEDFTVDFFAKGQ